MNIVYILTNEAMPGLVKVGKTRSDLLSRIRHLDTTGVPLPFECFYAVEVADCDVAERLLHDAFADQRVRRNREFFEIAPERIASALKLAALREVTPDGTVIQDQDDANAVERTRNRRGRFNFRLADIPIGSVLEHIRSQEETCVVVDAHRVTYQNEETSLSQAALQVYKSLGYNWRAVSGPASWLFDGETLDERRKRIEDEE